MFFGVSYLLIEKRLSLSVIWARNLKHLQITRKCTKSPYLHALQKTCKYATTKNVDILLYTRNKVNHISQLPVNSLCLDLF